ncbi:MAG: hypothetical protein ACOX7P_05800 [Oscillospiraceae bacterium]
MDIEISDIVVSLAGRDKGKYFFVVGTDGDYAFIADGKGRCIGSPKRKKRKHLRRVAESDSRVAYKLMAGDRVLDSEIRRALAAYAAQADANQLRR